MQFYPHRTVEEQKNRLPQAFQANYEKTQIDRIEIDGCEIHGYFEYSFMEEKSYAEQPVRSNDGSISNLEDYTTFLTPRLIIKYNMMNIDDYRTLMTFLKTKNTFNVTCYDVVADRRVTHEMYFANPSMPVIYQRYLAALGVQEYTIELIGTNRKEETFVFYIESDGRYTYDAHQNDTWISFVLRGETDYKIMYSKSYGGFIVTKNNGESALKYINDLVSPNDAIVEDGEYYDAYAQGVI